MHNVQTLMEDLHVLVILDLLEMMVHHVLVRYVAMICIFKGSNMEAFSFDGK